MRHIKKPCRNPREKHRLLLLLLPSSGNFCQSPPPTPFLLACLLMQIIKSKPSNTRRYIPRHRESVIQNSHAARQKRDDHAQARDKNVRTNLAFFEYTRVPCLFLVGSRIFLEAERQSGFFGRFRTEFLNRPEPRTRRYRWLADFKEECRRSCFP